MRPKQSKKKADHHPKIMRPPTSILPRVVFLRTKPFENSDTRRIISGVAGDFGFPLHIRQVKMVTFTKKAVNNRLVVGNHRHFGESGQWELIIVLGMGRAPAFRFRYRNYTGGVREKLLRGGDIALIPPGCSLALVALEPQATIIEISNQEYRSVNYIEDKLF